MTKEEAIEIINRENDPNNTAVWEVFPEYREALDMAIQALSQEPCTDAVSREAVLSKKIYTETEEGWSGYTVDADYIERLPPVTPTHKHVGSTQQNIGDALDMRCDDAIAVKDAEECKELMTDVSGDTVYAVRMSDIRQLPPVTPSCDKCAMNGSGSKYCDNCKQKSGKWILLDECANSGYYCSECQKKLVKEGWSNTVKKINFCPNCGCHMVEPQESEE